MKYRSSRSSLSCSSYSGNSYRDTMNYSRIRNGLRRYVPAAIVLWAFHCLPTKDGLTSRRVINFIKKHYKDAHDPSKTGKSISTILRCAVEFGLLKRRGHKYYLP
ncbi:unnamed protein product [Danaus chrysippus]|uniref:(African queen) hypothetical protein n=1 Tax=Danaus chrysippus TaxID=151541 RepID=A0A8J2WAJ3_9NEOP|nr:unnamed protein product [Danaus chrysippus]